MKTSDAPWKQGFVEQKPVLADYELLRLIGRGSYGDVWLARGQTGVLRAVKLVWRERFEDADPFEREFRGLRKFVGVSRVESHQMAVLHVGRDPGGSYFYYVMELADDAVSGVEINPDAYVPLTAKELMRRRGRLPVSECLEIGIALARNLAGLHARGLVHRDVKPSNIIIVNGSARLADIGLVTSHEQARTPVGSEGFMPPEGPGTPAADVFALGRVLYELSTGLESGMFPRLPADVIRDEEKEVFAALNSVILKACERDIRRRPADAGVVLNELLVLAQARLPRRNRAGLGMGPGSLAAVVLIALVAAGAAAWAWLPAKGPAVSPAAAGGPAEAKQNIPSIAVLPFINLSDDKRNEYFSDGVSEELLSVLAKVPGLKVAARSSAFHYKEHRAPLAEIGHRLGVDYVLEGSVRKAGGRVRITTHLVKISDGFQVSSETYDRDLDDIFTVQDEIARLILSRLRASIMTDPGAHAGRAGNDLETANQGRTQSVEAYNRLLEGRYWLNQRTPEGLHQAAALFRQAVGIDPHYALAWANLAYTCGWMVSFGIGSYEDAIKPGLEAAERCIRLAPDLADGYAALAGVSQVAWQWNRGERAITQALELAPENADVIQTASWVALNRGDYAGCMAYARKTLSLDPFNIAAILNLALAHKYSGNYAEARKAAEKMMELNTNSHFAGCIMLNSFIHEKKFDEALAFCRQNPAYRLDAYARALIQAIRGERVGGEDLAEIAGSSPGYAFYRLAAVHALRGDADEAFARLEAGALLHASELALIRHDPFFRRLHTDPRWSALMTRMHPGG
jgi:TolB-like protein/tetratricopeptide (TPR) repeat protein